MGIGTGPRSCTSFLRKEAAEGFNLLFGVWSVGSAFSTNASPILLSSKVLTLESVRGERLSEDVHREVLAFRARGGWLAIRLTSSAVVCSSTGGRGTGPVATAPAAAADFCLPMDHSKGC